MTGHTTSNALEEMADTVIDVSPEANATLLEQLDAIEDYGMQAFWDDEAGGCPCFQGTKTENGYTVGVRGRCWRVSDGCRDHKPWRQNLYVWGGHPNLVAIGESVKRALDAEEWYNPYQLIFGKCDEFDD